MAEQKEFNLLHENWLLVRKSDGSTEEVSLLNLFRHAHEYQGLAGELPTQDVAILRLLLAILHAVFRRYDPEGKFNPITSPSMALERWKSLWDRGTFPMGIIEEHLLHFEERFWLFHPKYPFYQVALEEPVLTATGTKIIPTTFEASVLIGDIAESENKTRLFSFRTQKDCISYAEAARWLLYTNSFDAAPGGRPSSAGITIKGYGLSWLSQLGLVWAIGANLFETLMLNFVLATQKETWGEPEIIWERKGTTSPDELLETEPAFPKEPCGLLTMQFRRMQLIRCNTRKCVLGYRLWSGQALNTENAFLETMTLWRKINKDTYTPKLHDEARQLWRDFAALFAVSDDHHRPGVVAWLDLLKRHDFLQLPLIQLAAAGVKYKQNTTIADVFTDSIRVNLNILTSIGESWINRIIELIAATEKLVDQLGELAQNLAKATGNTDGSREKTAAKEQAYFRLDTPFRRWLEKIDPSQDSMQNSCDQWLEQARKIVRGIGEELVAQSGPQAIVGRYIKEKIKGKDVENLYTAPKAFNRFLYRISKPFN